jgi:hypothetical protein
VAVVLSCVWLGFRKWLISHLRKLPKFLEVTVTAPLRVALGNRIVSCRHYSIESNGRSLCNSLHLAYWSLSRN